MNDLQQLVAALSEAAHAIGMGFTTVWLPIQIGLILLAALVSGVLGAIFRRRVDLDAIASGWPAFPRRILHQIAANFGTIIFILLTSSMRIAMAAATLPSRSYLLAVAAKLATAWIVIALAAGLIQNRFVYRVVTVTAWVLAALSILQLLDPVSALLDAVAINLGGLRLTPLLLLKTTVLLLITLWAATAVSDFLDRRVRLAADLTPSIQVLIGKVIRFGLIALGIMIVLSSVGIDLSALALFSGAVGVGIGFGLQKIVSNLVSGIILLADKSIKPGDIISVGDSIGWVVTMGARYTSVTTRDGREVLIPNEELVTQRVINWSYSKDDIRLELKFFADVANDPHEVQRVALEAVHSIPRVLKTPPPSCHFMEITARSMDFSLRFWINDPTEGQANLKSAVLLAIWDGFKREGLTFPSPVQDIRLRDPVRVTSDDNSEN